MTLLLITVLLAPAVAVSIVVLSSRRRRSIAENRGFYFLLAAAGWAAALALVARSHGPELLRMVTSDGQRAEAAFLDAIPSDPAGLLTIANQLPQYAKPDARSAEAWASWQERLRRHLTEQVFELDFASSMSAQEVEVRREFYGAGIKRIELGISAADGDVIPAVLLLPDGAHRVPGVLFIPGHVALQESGLEQLVLDVESYHNSAARELALAGFATLTIELRGFGLRGPPRFPEHRIVAYNALLAGSFYKKVTLSDIKRAFDVLQSLPEVDPDRVGISGASLGGELAVEYAALDKRVKAVSFHSHGGSVGPYTGLADPEAGQPHYCHIIPGSNKIMMQDDPFLLLAPRPTQGIRGEEQRFRDPAFAQNLQNLWAMMNAADVLELTTVPGRTKNHGHVYYVEPAVRFFKEHL